MRFLLLVTFLMTTQLAFSQNKQVDAVKALLEQQQKDWNKGDIDAFMEGYWKSEKLQFISSQGVTYGWGLTKTNYKKTYPNKSAMGKLDFDLLEVDKHSKNLVTVTGKYMITRKNGEVLSGYFLLVVKKIEGKWRIISDHTSSS